MSSSFDSGGRSYGEALVADEVDATLEPLGAELRGRACPGETGADHDDRCGTVVSGRGTDGDHGVTVAGGSLEP
ncbi:hypothetical protein GCM10025865_03680 [Paraoerskovia sediminicola]|uniref:Uncharacterized protein n=1 Tax=Paraoerskovia sediminicola TaxID=1138587 RepID=A0ABN6X8J9_9CELL|nr:hypothetical protein GCM10025865_03680 [Paraoerskovia sediminicola]